MQPSAHQPSQQWPLPRLWAAVAVCSRSFFCLQAAQEFYTMDSFGCDIVPMDAAVGHAVLASTARQRTSTVYQSQEASFPQERQEGQKPKKQRPPPQQQQWQPFYPAPGPYPGYAPGYPPWTPQQAPPPPPPLQTPGGSVQKPKTADPFEAKFNALLSAVARAGETVPQEVQEVAQSLSMPESLPEPQTLEEAFERVGTARKALDQAMLARYQMHNTWRTFLADSAKKWNEFALSFQKQELALSTQVQTAKTVHKTAIGHFEKMKTANPGTDLTVETVSDEETMDADKDTKPDASKAIQETMHSMRDTFANLKTKADSLIEEEQASKKPRLSSLPSMQPFGQPGV